MYQVLGSQQSATSWEEGRREKARSDLTNEILDSVCLLFPGIVPKRFSPWEKRRYCEEAITGKDRDVNKNKTSEDRQGG